MAVELPIIAFKRVQFGGTTGDGDIPIVGVNWTAAAFKLEVRNRPGDTGAALISITDAAIGSQGVSATYEAAYTLPDGSTAPATIVRIQIDEATIEAVPLAADASDPLELYYDLHVTPTSEAKRVICFGTFTIMPGATI